MRNASLFPVLCLLVSVAGDAKAQTRVASWNIQNLGWNNGKDYLALAEVGAWFDLISVQEVMTEEGIARFQEALSRRTGIDWERICSHLLGRGSYREMYCLVWRPDEVSLLGGAAIYLDDRDVFAREPFSANFVTRDGFAFVATSIHAVYGNSVAERAAEAEALRGYRDWLVSISDGLPVFLMGDFNLAPSNPAWAALGEVAYPLIQEGATTISTIDGRFANLYDNIWVPVGMDLPVAAYGRLEFPRDVLGISHAEARAKVSDHIPVWVEIDVLGEWSRFPTHDVSPSGIRSARTENGDVKMDWIVYEFPDFAVVGNRNSGLYHLPWCPSYELVAPRNRAAFVSVEDAKKNGYRRAGNCGPRE